MCTEEAPSILDRGRHAGLPLVKGLPGRLDGADDSFLKMGRILLHDDDRLLKGVLLIDLFMELADNGEVGNVSGEDERGARKGRSRCTHGSVLAVT